MAESAALAAANLARICCLCGCQAVVTCPGDEALFIDSTHTHPDGRTLRFRERITRGKPDIDLCLEHAATRWPWKSETTKRKRTPRHATPNAEAAHPDIAEAPRPRAARAARAQEKNAAAS